MTIAQTVGVGSGLNQLQALFFTGWQLKALETERPAVSIILMLQYVIQINIYYETRCFTGWVDSVGFSINYSGLYSWLKLK